MTAADWLLAGAFFVAYAIHKSRVGFAWQERSDKYYAWQDGVAGLAIIATGCALAARFGGWI